MTQDAQVSPSFTPLRLGHANMFVGDLERSSEFYNNIAGVELVRREPSISMAFHSNGKSHHDLGLVQVKPGERLGIKGYAQVSSNRASRPGLNHLGWEMDSEIELIHALDRSKHANLKVTNFANHQLSHAAYTVDPDGNYHEFYADTVVRWRDIFNLDHEELVTEAWDWEGSRPGLGRMPPDPKDVRRIDDAVFHPRGISYVTLAVTKFDAAVDFLKRVGGLTVTAKKDGVAMLRGASADLDLLLIATEHGLQPGLRAIGFQVNDEDDLLTSRRTAARLNVPVIAALDLPHKRNVVVNDPDGVLVEFHHRKPGAKAVLPSVDSGNKNWMFAA